MENTIACTRMHACIELLLKYIGVDLDENAIAHVVSEFSSGIRIIILFFSFCEDFFSSLCEP